ncbi:hypothetical protein ANANG_G00001140 [Anguilla anguilla]|uniref:Sushi domain-containing protein n=1 Tax=Anguilla anguilla TaxID=7936 RepID=A0A9D3MV68_ANGAN|nr:hypothetical protein ANANG_G00001140 [Anguilla anguilla]
MLSTSTQRARGVDTLLSGFRLPAPIVSTGTHLTLWFLSDYAVSGQGFRVSYEALPSFSCGDPGRLLNGVQQGSSFRMGDRVHFGCSPGYTLEGHAVLTCQATPTGTASWDFPCPTAERMRSVAGR